MSSELYIDIAHASSVDLNTATTSPAGVAIGVDALDEDGAVIASLDASGLLSYRPDKCSAIPLANGAVIKAIRPLYSDGSAQSSANYEGQGGTPRKFRPLLLRSTDGGSITLVHDAAPPTPEPDNEWDATERIAGQFGNDVVLLNAWVYLQWEYVGGARRWRAAAWGAPLGSPANYATPPTTHAQEWARLEAAVVTLLGGTIPD